jgi:hypothetical protein
MFMKIPVFVSCPTSLNPAQEAVREKIIKYLSGLNIEPRALGRSDYPTEFPLREVLIIAKHCSGGVILGFEQIQVYSGIIKPGSPEQKSVTKKTSISIPTPWNQLEAGIIFGLNLPLLIFREPTISGGVFDNGVTDVFVHTFPTPTWKASDEKALQEVFLKWHAKVRTHYYS